MPINGYNLACKLAACEREEDVIRILQELDLWNDPKYWRSFGDNDNNFSTIGNQQSEADAALVEKIVNSIDAILMKECLKRGIATDSESAPKSIPDALEKYFSIPEGNLAEISTELRTKLSNDIKLIATGGIPAKGGQLNLTIVDNGEGQTPQEMPNTILSINKSNKLRVPFVQGKFNMGGTGVLRFCGEHNLQLIISRRCQTINNDKNDPTFNKWGVTLIKRDVPDKNSRSSVYKYLVGDDKNIISFENPEGGLDIIPCSTDFRKVMESGMYCKLYNYQLKPRYATNINMGLYYRLSTLLPSLAYPVYLDECRDFKGHTMHRTLTGLTVRLNDELKRENSDIEYQSTSSFTILGQTVTAHTFLFKEKDEINGKIIDLTQYRDNEGLLLIQNGQTHASATTRFYKKQSVNLSYLADSLLTIIDCSNINAQTRENLFMNSRDRIGSCQFKDLLIEELENFFHDDQKLRDLQNDRREKAINSKLNDNKPLEAILKNVFRFSPVLAKIFNIGDKLTNPYSSSKTSGGGSYDGRYYPTYFELAKKDDEVNFIKEAHIGRKARVKFRTDVVNDYFTRNKNRGSYTLYANGIEMETYSLHLFDGYGNLNITLDENWGIGTEVDMKFVVIDKDNNKTFENNFKLQVIENVEMNSTNDPYTPPGDDTKKHALKNSGVSLPNINEVYEDQWEQNSMDEKTSLVVKRSGSDENGDLFDFFVNMDNIHLKTELKLVANDNPKVLLFKGRYKYAFALLGMSMIAYFKETKKTEDESFDIEEEIKENCKMISPVVLPIITILGDPNFKLNDDID